MVFWPRKRSILPEKRIVVLGLSCLATHLLYQVARSVPVESLRMPCTTVRLMLILRSRISHRLAITVACSPGSSLSIVRMRL